MNDFFTKVEEVFHDWNYGHPKILWGLIRALKPEAVLEVGTYRGYAAAYMAHALKMNGKGKLYCIDNFSLTDHVQRYGDPEQHWIENLSRLGVRDVVELIKGWSHQVEWPESVDFAYIDGWHSYHQAKTDFVMADGRGATCICLDDTLNCIGPRKVVAELNRQEWTVATLPNDNGLSICQRAQKRRVTFSQELLNSPGTILTNASDEELAGHLNEAAIANGVFYKMEELT